uniref:Uncharacterized protein n=2 Tax=Anguilla anguilla TaxID=7936 RepID=A0A0E9UUB7_ANGAN
MIQFYKLCGVQSGVICVYLTDHKASLAHSRCNYNQDKEGS